MHTWHGPIKEELLGKDTQVYFKLELLQTTGTFKLRGALTTIDSLDRDQKAYGVVAATGGNHGVAVAHAAHASHVHAKVVVPQTMNPLRRDLLVAYGAEVITTPTIADAFTLMQEIAQSEQRFIIHPFEGRAITLGTATLGLEFIRQVQTLDLVVVPIGGGGLASGVACAIKQIRPSCRVIGVEPTGANSMRLSLDAGQPVKLESSPRSIADSLCAPSAQPYSFGICQRYLDDVVLIDDAEMAGAMQILFEHLKLATEPAGAAATAAMLGPLKERCRGKNVGIIICGSNINFEAFKMHLT